MPVVSYYWTRFLTEKTSTSWSFQLGAATRSSPFTFGIPWPILLCFTLTEMLQILVRCTSCSSNWAFTWELISWGTSFSFSLFSKLIILLDYWLTHSLTWHEILVKFLYFGYKYVDLLVYCSFVWLCCWKLRFLCYGSFLYIVLFNDMKETLMMCYH